MKLLFFIIDLSGGGAQRVLATLANAFVKNGHNVTIATNTEKGIAFSFDDRINIVDLEFSKFKNGNKFWSRIKSLIHKLIVIRQTVKNSKPDVVIPFMNEMNVDVILATRFVKTFFICCEHTNVQVPLVFPYNFLRPLTYPMADIITVLTEHDLNIWRNHKNVIRMYNPIDLDEFSRKSEIKKEKIILAAGRIQPVKGFDNLIKSWSLIFDEFPDWTLAIAGTGKDDYVQYLTNLIKANKCNNVELLGFRKDIKDIMQKSSIYVLSSHHEGLPMVLIEAMACGCCCVSFDCNTGPNEIIEHEISGLLVEDQNIYALANGLKKIMIDYNFREYLSSNNMKSIEKFSLETIVFQWENLLKKASKKWN